MALFQNKYRIESIRLKDWDYSTPWWYYVTINTKNHVGWFGKVVKGKMQLNSLGLIVDEEWLKTKTLRCNVDLDYYVIMPNHFHGIIILNENSNAVETRRGESLQSNPGESLPEEQNEFGKPQKNSLSVIINEFKGSVKRWANKNKHEDFFWQSRFYDRIIRNEKELFQIRKYIEQNPLKWDIEKNDYENLIID